MSALRRRPANSGICVDAELVRFDIPAARRAYFGKQATDRRQKLTPGRLRSDLGGNRLEPALHATMKGIVGSRLPVCAMGDCTQGDWCRCGARVGARVGTRPCDILNETRVAA